VIEHPPQVGEASLTLADDLKAGSGPHGRQQ